MKVSYECSDLISEIKSDISEFGEKARAWEIWKTTNYKIPFTNKKEETEILVNYLLDEEGNQPPTEEEKEGGRAVYSTLQEILNKLEEQNRII